MRPQLDTIFLDLAAERLDGCSVQCTWRIVFDQKDTENIEIDFWPADKAAERWQFAESPHPDAVAKFDPRFAESKT